MKIKLSLVLVLLGVFLLVVSCAPQAPGSSATTSAKEQYKTLPSGESTANQGRVVFTIADAAADMNSVSRVVVTIDSISVHSDTEGWVTVSSIPQTTDLLLLKAEGAQRLLADVKLKEGSYQQLRLDISKVVVTDNTGEHQAKLPSGELKIIGGFNVSANSTSTAKFDFIADESLHRTGNGEYILAPVVQLETREDADVDVKADNKVEVKNGHVKTNIKVGMDVDGNVGVGLHIPKEAKVSLSNGKVKLETTLSVGLGSGSGKEESAQENTNASANAAVKVKVGY